MDHAPTRERGNILLHITFKGGFEEEITSDIQNGRFIEDLQSTVDVKA